MTRQEYITEMQRLAYFADDDDELFIRDCLRVVLVTIGLELESELEKNLADWCETQNIISDAESTANSECP